MQHEKGFTSRSFSLWALLLSVKRWLAIRNFKILDDLDTCQLLFFFCFCFYLLLITYLLSLFRSSVFQRKKVKLLWTPWGHRHSKTLTLLHNSKNVQHFPMKLGIFKIISTYCYRGLSSHVANTIFSCMKWLLSKLSYNIWAYQN